LHTQGRWFGGKAHAPWGENQWWFTDEFADGPRRLMDAFWAVPEWAPADIASAGLVFRRHKNRLRISQMVITPFAILLLLL